MTETPVQEQKGDTSFWSPWAVFFLGIFFAALNWWRMGKKGKAILFLVLSYLVNMFASWTEFVGGITPTDHAISFEVSLARLILYLAFAGVLAIIMASDIKRFQKEEKSSVSVKWQMIFVFWAFLVVAYFGTWKVLDYGAKSVGECNFPRLQDVIYQNELEQRTGLATLVLGRKDFSCDWVWDIESVEYLGENGYRLLLVGDMKENNDASLSVYEQLFHYQEYTADEFIEKAKPRYKYGGVDYVVNIEDPNARYSNVECFRSDNRTFCNLAFGYKKVISKIELTFSDLADEQINELIRKIVSTNSTRIHEYEAGLP